MDLGTVGAIGRFLAQVDVAETPLTVSWHAGEPLTVSPRFYDTAFQILDETPGGPRLRHIMQTNGTLIDERWCNLFRKWNVQVGVSLDGPEWLHDLRRRDRRGQGTHARVLRGVRALQECGLRPTVIAVLTDRSLQHPKEVWESLVGAGFCSIAFNVEETDGVNTSSLSHVNARQKYYNFLTKVIELRAGNPDVEVRELDDIERFLRASHHEHIQSIENLPGAIINIGSNGDVSTFSPELLGMSDPVFGRFTWGNVHRDTWDKIRSNQHFNRVAQAIGAGVERCRTQCGYFAICGGGAPSNKLGEHGTFDATKTLYCSLRVMAVTDAYLQHLNL